MVHLVGEKYHFVARYRNSDNSNKQHHFSAYCLVGKNIKTHFLTNAVGIYSWTSSIVDVKTLKQQGIPQQIKYLPTERNEDLTSTSNEN